MSSPALTAALRTALARRETPEIVLAYLFGSEARGEAAAGSDVDVGVLAMSPLDLLALGTLQETLSLATGRQVDVVDLSAAPPLLLGEVAREGVPFLVKDREAQLDFELDALRRWEDTRFLRRQQQELLRERALRGR